MSKNNYILNVKDESIYIITECKEKVIKARHYKIIEGVLTYTPEYYQVVALIINQLIISVNGILEKIVYSKFLNKVIV